MGTNYFVDSSIGDDTDDGTTMDDGPGGGTGAWATLEKAMESGTPVDDGDTVWVRRTHSETPLSNIECLLGATSFEPIKVVGWPRAAEPGITSATWTNGDATVDVVVGLSMDHEQHCGRYITAPDGNKYLITMITDANTFEIDREYPSATVTGTDGAATIHADEDYDTAQAIDVAYATEKAAWTADADDLPLIDWNGTNFNFSISSDLNMSWRNLRAIDSIDGTGVFYINSAAVQEFIGCLIENTNNVNIMYVATSNLLMQRCVIIGDSTAGAGNTGLYITGSLANLKDVAMYDIGYWGLEAINGAVVYLDNVNIGIEDTCTDNCISYTACATVVGNNVNLVSSTDEVESYGRLGPRNRVSIENYGKIVGAHRMFTPGGYFTKVDVVAGSGDPYKRTAGADSVVELLMDLGHASNNYKSPAFYMTEGNIDVFTHEFQATTDSRRYRYYVQAEGAVLASELWIEVEYVSVYDDTSEHYIKKVTSDEGITIRSGASDWSQYIEVEDIEPAVGSTVRIKCYCRYYDASNKIYIDPLCEVTT